MLTSFAGRKRWLRPLYQWGNQDENEADVFDFLSCRLLRLQFGFARLFFFVLFDCFVMITTFFNSKEVGFISLS